MKSATRNFTKLKYANLVEWNSILTPSCRETRSWSLFFVFILLQVLLCSRKYMKLPKFGILVNKTTYLFTSVKSNISRGCVKILEILEGSGGGGGGKFWGLILENHMANPFCGGGMDIFCRNHTMFNTVHKCQSIKLLWSKCKFEIFLF